MKPKPLVQLEDHVVLIWNNSTLLPRIFICFGSVKKQNKKNDDNNNLNISKSSAVINRNIQTDTSMQFFSFFMPFREVSAGFLTYSFL